MYLVTKQILSNEEVKDVRHNLICTLMENNAIQMASSNITKTLKENANSRQENLITEKATVV